MEREKWFEGEGGSLDDRRRDCERTLINLSKRKKERKRRCALRILGLQVTLHGFRT